MENFEKPIYPITNEVPEGYEGLTKREYFAGLAMQGILSKEGCNFSLYSTLADISVHIADALLERLSLSQKENSDEEIKKTLNGISVKVSGRLAFGLFALKRISRGSFDNRCINVDSLVGIRKVQLMGLRNVSSKTVKELEIICETYCIPLKDC